MRIVGLAGRVVACGALLATSLAAGAAVIRLNFADVNFAAPPPIAGPNYPVLEVVQITPPATVPIGERVVSATVSGTWGTFDWPQGSAPARVFLDGVLVAKCEANESCWAFTSTGTRIPWSYALKPAELEKLNPMHPKLTVEQTGPTTVRVGSLELVMETAPWPAVPTLSPLGMLALLAGVAAAGAIALRRFPRG